MESDRTQSKDPRINFDLLKALAADALTRKVAGQARDDRPWQALTNALQHAVGERLRNSASSHQGLTPQDVTEAEVRRRLIEAYMQQPNGARAIKKAKLAEDSLSFFSQAGYETLEEVEEHWAWYLYCLTFEEQCFDQLTTMMHIPGQMDNKVNKYSIAPEHQPDFRQAFQITFRVCFNDFSARPPCILEVTQGHRSVLQLSLGSRPDNSNCIIVRVLTKSGYGPSGQKEPSFVRNDGMIAKDSENCKSGELLRQTMTVEEAKRKAALLVGCKGFCFHGEDVGEPVEVFFKDHFQRSIDVRYKCPGGWTSYRLENTMQDWLQSAPLKPRMWHDVTLTKRARHFSLAVDAEVNDEWAALEDADPYYSELSNCDSISFGGNLRQPEQNLAACNGWLAEASVKVGDPCASDGPPPNVVRMPLDKVDLQVVAMTFQAQITVTHLMEEAWLFRPPGGCTKGGGSCCAHLLRYGPLWTAMLGPRPPEDEPRPLAGAIVELGDLPALLQPASHRSAVVLEHDRDLNAYWACVDQVKFPLERNQIKRVVYQEDNKGETCDLAGLPNSRWSPEALRQVPIGSVWFQLLHELVRKNAADRLHTCHLQLKGVVGPDGKDLSAAPASSRAIAAGSRQRSEPPRAALPPPAAQAQENRSDESGGSSQTREVGDLGFKPAGAGEVPRQRRSSPAAPAAASTARAPHSSERRRLADVKTDLAVGRRVLVSVVRNWAPGQEGYGQLPVKALDQVYVKECHEHWMLCHYNMKEVQQAWCPTSCLTLLEVVAPFVPDASWDARFLPLHVGQSILMTRTFKGAWHGWAAGRTYEGFDDDHTPERIFPLSSTEHVVLIVP